MLKRTEDAWWMALLCVSIDSAPARALICLLGQEKSQQKTYCQVREVFWGQLRHYVLLFTILNPKHGVIHTLAEIKFVWLFTHCLPWHFVYVCRAGEEEFDASLSVSLSWAGLVLLLFARIASLFSIPLGWLEDKHFYFFFNHHIIPWFVWFTLEITIWLSL